MRSIIIHPGFAKTGTTSLQHNIFDKHTEFINIGYPTYDISGKLKNTFYKKKKNFIKNFIADFTFYDEKYCLKLLDELINNEKKTVIFSCEALCEAVFRNEIILERLKKFFCNAKILFTIRGQYSSIESKFSNNGLILKNLPHPYNYKKVNFNNWLDFSINNFENPDLMLRDQHLPIIKYYPLIKRFSNFFGKENIKIKLYEDMKNNFDEWMRDLSVFLDISFEEIKNAMSTKLHTRQTIGMYKLRKFNNNNPKLFNILRNNIPKEVRVKIISYLNKTKKINFKLSDQHKEIIRDLYKEDNKKLLSEFNLNLKDIDYPL